MFQQNRYPFLLNRQHVQLIANKKENYFFYYLENALLVLTIFNKNELNLEQNEFIFAENEFNLDENEFIFVENEFNLDENELSLE